MTPLSQSACGGTPIFAPLVIVEFITKIGHEPEPLSNHKWSRKNGFPCGHIEVKAVFLDCQ